MGGENIRKVAEEIERNHLLGLQMEGAITLQKEIVPAIAGIPYMGAIEDLVLALDREVVQRAIFRIAPGNLVPACVILNKVKNIGGSYYSQYHYYSGKKDRKQ